MYVKINYIYHKSKMLNAYLQGKLQSACPPTEVLKENQTGTEEQEFCILILWFSLLLLISWCNLTPSSLYLFPFLNSWRQWKDFPKCSLFIYWIREVRGPRAGWDDETHDGEGKVQRLPLWREMQGYYLWEVSFAKFSFIFFQNSMTVAQTSNSKAILWIPYQSTVLSRRKLEVVGKRDPSMEIPACHWCSGIERLQWFSKCRTHSGVNSLNECAIP